MKEKEIREALEDILEEREYELKYMTNVPYTEPPKIVVELDDGETITITG